MVLQIDGKLHGTLSKYHGKSEIGANVMSQSPSFDLFNACDTIERRHKSNVFLRRKGLCFFMCAEQV